MKTDGQVWNAELYDNKLGFVSDYGKGVVELLNAQPGEHILDVGCGTGELTNEIAKSGAIVSGMDMSEEMIEKARAKYANIQFQTGDAEQFTTNTAYDAIFSNAALHWIKKPEKAIACMWNALKPGGRLVVEFGGHRNVGTVVSALYRHLVNDYGVDAEARNPWYFPSIASYTSLLENQGFDVLHAALFERPTKMEDGEKGLAHWLNGFANTFVADFSAEQKEELFDKVAGSARGQLFRDGAWYVDYKRLRVIASKPSH
ncbi:class I SAM-dependent methyltransferase [Paenibacillus sp. NEAU-GSW1]|uniref:class I SAM-dependent methyltransferase n=1 Tax=Paenibacillus sp. NEAU-GSW1 TaxID=2682486 RepID=UPI0012E1BF0F|nr:class I SAM-dependent methyltransferase [Paenibacillus sp. NEAU-GSW1]MUT66636.1 methyltransferase domain-containing protein [Paenibacillus sp. NEAU-GSW1]